MPFYLIFKICIWLRELLFNYLFLIVRNRSLESAMNVENTYNNNNNNFY